MSRQYDMTIEVKGLEEKAHMALIEEAITQNWNTSYDFLDPEADAAGTWKFLTGGEGALCGGETEEEFTSRISEAIWDALGYFVSVTINAIYLEDLPCETHCMEEEEYTDYLKRMKEKQA